MRPLSHRFVPAIRSFLVGAIFAGGAIAAETETAPPSIGGRDRAALRAEFARGQDLSRVKIPEGVKLIPDLAYREGNPMWKLDLAMPEAKSEQPRPAIVFIHGGGWRGGDKRAGYFLGGALEFAAKGYVGVTINYRLTGEAPFPACVEDVRCAVRWLRAKAAEYNIDPNRIGAYGNSAGAHLVCLLGLAENDRELDGDAPYREFSSGVQAVCASAAPTDFVAGIGAGQGRFQNPGMLLHGPPETYEARARQASPVHHAHAGAPPILLIHGDADRVVAPEQSKLLYRALKNVGAKDVVLMSIHDAGHGVFVQHRSITVPAMEAFFARTLKAK